LPPPFLIKLLAARHLSRNSELETLKRTCKQAASEKKISESDLGKLSAAFGQRFERAKDAIGGKRVKKYTFRPSGRVVWIVVGKKRDYLIMPAADFCTCDDFYFRVMDEQIHLCYHVLAQKLAEAVEVYDSYEEEDKLHEVLMKEWRKTIP